jgi:hypothetical protein
LTKLLTVQIAEQVYKKCTPDPRKLAARSLVTENEEQSKLNPATTVEEHKNVRGTHPFSN